MKHTDFKKELLALFHWILSDPASNARIAKEAGISAAAVSKIRKRLRETQKLPETVSVYVGLAKARDRITDERKADAANS